MSVLEEINLLIYFTKLGRKLNGYAVERNLS